CGEVCRWKEVEWAKGYEPSYAAWNPADQAYGSRTLVTITRQISRWSSPKTDRSQPRGGVLVYDMSVCQVRPASALPSGFVSRTCVWVRCACNGAIRRYRASVQIVGLARGARNRNDNSSLKLWDTAGARTSFRS